MKLHKSFLLFGTSLLLLTACGNNSEDNSEEVTEEQEVEEVESTDDKDNTELPDGLKNLRVTDVRNDNTGNWKKVVDSKNFNMPENAIAYYEEYMEEGEIHYLISFATNTTTMINDLNGLLYVNITEYENKEEHSADTIGGGMTLKSYDIYTDSGEIEEIDE